MESVRPPHRLSSDHVSKHKGALKQMGFKKQTNKVIHVKGLEL